MVFDLICATDNLLLWFDNYEFGLDWIGLDWIGFVLKEL